MFHRKTDEFVRDNIFCVIDNIRKMPLEVGADRIARTAYSALDLLHKLRAQTGQEIRLAWKREDVRSGTWAIEVYPAGTLAAHQIDGRQDYKRKDKDREKARRGIVEQLKVKKHLKLPSDEASLRCLLDNDDALDAAICVLAGVDFLARDVLEPKDAGVSMEVAKKEGWIWVKKPV